MATGKAAVIRDIKRYVARLNKSGIPVEKVLLFGSWARGNPRRESDVDIALISPVFTGDRFLDRRKIVPLRREINTRIEPIPFNPQTFAEGGILVDEIIRYSEEIVS
ncbi:MAG: nucleotidyltransferase domain-containing protein [Acidobacteriota bacterium]|nr:nucleotidyltransferase domain-containing protein [Acidobacteriota bacterium]